MPREKVQLYTTTLPNEEEWAILYVSEVEKDAVLECGYGRECTDTWWPEENPPADDDDWEQRYENLTCRKYDTVEVNLEKFCALVLEHIGRDNAFGRESKRFFVLRFEDDEAEFYTQASDEKEAIARFIDHIKDNIGEMSDYCDIDGKPITSWSQIVTCEDKTEFML